MNDKIGMIRVAVTLLLLLAFGLPAHSQTILFGGRIAGQITDTFTKEFSASAITEDRVEFGPMVEFGLPRHLHLEVDALYKRRLNYNHTFVGGDRNGVFHVVINDTTTRFWEIPVLLKWHLSKQPAHPFIGAGFSVRHIGGSSHIYGSNTPPPPFGGMVMLFDFQAAPSDLVRPWTAGMIAAAGVDIHRGLFHFQPELRYTRWPNVAFAFGSRGVSNLNRFQILFGIAVGND